MLDSEIAAHIQSIRSRLTTIEARYRQARANLYDWSGLGYPAKSLGGGSAGGGGHSDPVLATAARSLEIPQRDRDRYRDEYRQIGDDLRDVDKQTAKVEDVVIAATVAASSPGVPGCKPCYDLKLRPHEHACDNACRARDHAHPGGWQRIHRRLPNPEQLEEMEPVDGDDAPRVPPLVPYCSWHAEFIERYGVEPARAIVVWHLDHLGERIPRDLIRGHHPVEYATYHETLRATRYGA